MGKGNWYRDNLGDRLKRLYQLREDCRSDEVQAIEESIDILESLIYGESAFKKMCGRCLKDRIEFEDEQFFFFNEYIKKINLLASRETISLPKPSIIKDISKQELFDLVGSFFGEVLDNELYAVFKSLFKPREKRVFTERLGEMDARADTIYIPYGKENFTRIKRVNAIEDVVTLAHEYGHSLQFLVNFDPNIYGDNIVFSEVVSLFFELLATDYLKKIPEFKRGAHSCGIEYYNGNIRDAKRTIVIDKLLESWEELYHVSEKKMRKMVNADLYKYGELFKVNGEVSIDRLLDSDFSGNIKYLYSFTLALKLFVLYSYDKKRALEILKEFIHIDLKLSNPEYCRKVVGLGLEPEDEDIRDFEKIIEMKRCANF